MNLQIIHHIICVHLWTITATLILSFTAVFMYLDHKPISVFLSSFAPLRLCVRYKNVVHLPENSCKT